MKKKGLFIIVAALLTLTGCEQPLQQNQNSGTNEIAESNQNRATQSNYQLIQFHSEHRCMTCQKIEKFAVETAGNFENLPFVLINVDNEANESKAREFEATGTALFLYNTQTGEKKNLTEFAFMKAGDEEEFKTELKTKIESFLKS